ncbi:S-adenosyl-L-methionine-dependent methyltransferase [Martensiomyces pterosporus]|nr:S-adenosyl-L-methionine-dependent methyltransferase [Martensiomyces pterosporus]
MAEESAMGKDNSSREKEADAAAQRDDDEVLHRDPGYFQYYSQLQHQQNMLQDYVRTSAYHSAITLNGPSLFRDRLVMDVGAGSGILSFFAVQAGAKQVYAVEASGMADKMNAILSAAKRPHGAACNAYLADRITVVSSKIEEPRLLEKVPKVDAIISEPIGVLLVHERMLESYVYAREKFLKKGGAMLPSAGTIHLAPMSDANLWTETITKARFWQQSSFYGVDLNPYFAPSFDEYFSAPVVGCFSPTTLMGESVQHEVDFHTVTIGELKEFTIPIEWQINYTGLMHGVAGWFDLSFVPPASSLHPGTMPSATYMSTSPHSAATHWQQVRLLLKQPLAVNAGQVIRGSVHMKVNSQRSYDITASLIALDAGESAGIADDGVIESMVESQVSRSRTALWYLHEQIYNYSYTGEPTDPAALKPEAASLYLPVDALLAESSGGATGAAAQPTTLNNISVQGVSDNALTDFLVTASAPGSSDPSSSSKGPEAMQF